MPSQPKSLTLNSDGAAKGLSAKEASMSGNHASNLKGMIMNERIVWLTCAAALVAGSGIFLPGCGMAVKDTEQMLSAAGFTMKVADTPEKLAHLKTLTQHKLIHHTHDGKLYFVYADATVAKALFVGDEKAYQSFQKLQFQQNIADQNTMTAMENREALMNWCMWGPLYRRW